MSTKLYVNQNDMGLWVEEIKNGSPSSFSIGELPQGISEEDYAYLKFESGVISVDQDKKTLMIQQEAERAAKRALQASGDEVINLGSKAKSLMVGFVKSLDLPKTDRSSLSTQLDNIIGDLERGSIDLAIDGIKALVEDGTIITAESKALILSVFAEKGYNIS